MPKRPELSDGDSRDAGAGLSNSIHGISVITPEEAPCCRICLQHGQDEITGNFFSPCRCNGKVHRRCLDTWRATGINPANLTRCEVCQYRYKFSRGSAWQLYLYLYGKILIEVIIFVVLAVLVGYALKTSNFVQDFNFGHLDYLKPRLNTEWFGLGVAFNFFCIGLLTTLQVCFKATCGRGSVAAESRQTIARSASSDRANDWVAEARHKRNRTRGCVEDCEYCCCNYEARGPHYTPVYCYTGPDCYCCCDDCCFACDTCRCCDCPASAGDTASGACCDGCCKCDGDDVGAGILVVIVVGLVVLGALVSFWIVFGNVAYALQSHSTELRSKASTLYPIVEYDPASDDHQIQTPESTERNHPAEPEDKQRGMGVVPTRFGARKEVV